MKRLILLLFIAVLTFSGCSKPEAAGGTDIGAVAPQTMVETAEITTETQEVTTMAPIDCETKQEMSFKELEGKIKVYGRCEFIEEGMTCDWSASGFEANIDCSGNVWLMLETSKGSYFRAFVDGTMAPERMLAPGTTGSTLLIAENLAPGVHNIKVLKSSFASDSTATLQKLIFNGALAEAPADKEVFVEFIAASTTGGSGVLGVSTDAVNKKFTDAALAFPVILADELDLDYSVVVQGGSGIVKSYNQYIISKIYDYTCYMRDPDKKYGFERKPDAIFIRLGSNDAGCGITKDEYKAAVIDFTKHVMEVNDTPIIFWMWEPYYKELITECAKELGGSEAGVYAFAFPPIVRTGAANHPNIEEQKQIAAGILAEVKKLELDIFK